jgi:type II secretory pathway pseudopilin PulG
MRKNTKNSGGFTLIELIVYVATISVVIGAVVVFAVWATRLGAKIKINYAVSNNARRAMETMVYEIKKSYSVYTPTCVFDNPLGQLSLEQIATSTPGETTTFVDFFRCGNSLCFKKETSTTPQALTNSQVKISNLTFTHLINASSSSIQINLGMESSIPNPDPSYDSTINLTSTATLSPY